MKKENEMKRKNGLILRWRETKNTKVELVPHATKNDSWSDHPETQFESVYPFFEIINLGLHYVPEKFILIKWGYLGSVCFTENHFRENVFRKMTYGKTFYGKKKKEKKKTRKMFYILQKNGLIFSWPGKYFPLTTYFPWNKHLKIRKTDRKSVV